MTDKNNIFIEKAIIIHNNIYDYSKVNYVNASTKVTIICKDHGEFEQRPNTHLKKTGCPKCGKINCANKMRMTNDDFINKANKVHDNKFKYDKAVYINTNTKVIITCDIHGDFIQTPGHHLCGKG